MTAKKKRTVTGGMRVKAYEVLHRAVEEGVLRGYARAHKHTDDPGEETMKYEIENAVLGNICEVFDFDETPE